MSYFFQNFSYLATYVYAKVGARARTHTHILTHAHPQRETWAEVSQNLHRILPSQIIGKNVA